MQGDPTRTLVAFIAASMLLAGSMLAQRGRAPAAPSLPPLSMTCPHHPDVIESEPGACPYCKMALVPVRLSPAWSCPVHAATIADEGGTCPICRRALVPVTTSLTWTCAGSATGHLEPGVCPGGSPRALTRTLRPHGDHNPRHGGQFFMASDNWHHVEGAYPSDRVFRLYVYDDYARPLPPERLKRVQARVVTRERFEPATKTYVELSVFPMRMAGDGAYLEARIDRASLPAEMTAKVRFAPDAAEARFDFTFMSLTRAPAAPAAAPAAVARRGSARAPAPPAPRSAPAPAGPPVPATRPAAAGRSAGANAVPEPEEPAAPDADPALVPVPIPDTVPGILEQLRTRNEQVGALIARGDFGAVWVPAFAAKDLAIALEPHLAHLDAAKQVLGAPALQRVVRLAWVLDAHGDTGNRQQLLSAHDEFSAAVRDVASAFAEMTH